MPEDTTVGFFLKHFIDYLEEKKGKSGVLELEKRVGDINFSAFKNYLIEKELEVRKAIMEIIDGKETAEGNFRFGEIVFESYVESVIGKTMLALAGKDIKKLAKSLQKIFDTVNAGIKVKVEDLDKNKMKLTFYGNRLPIKHYEGVLSAALKHFGHQEKILCNEISSGDYEYIIEWNQKEQV